LDDMITYYAYDFLQEIHFLLPLTSIMYDQIIQVR